MRDAGFDVSFRDCPAKGGTGGHGEGLLDSQGGGTPIVGCLDCLFSIFLATLHAWMPFPLFEISWRQCVFLRFNVIIKHVVAVHVEHFYLSLFSIVIYYNHLHKTLAVDTNLIWTFFLATCFDISVAWPYFVVKVT
jgi:hypothetical protein